MQAYVFTDAGLAKRAGQFAWLSIDTDSAKTAAFQKKFPTTGVPTFMLIDPSTETALQAWYGTITVAQLNGWLDAGLRTLRNESSDPADLALRRADRLNAENKPAEAIAAFREALATGGPTWSGFSRGVESMMLAFELGGRSVTRGDCVSATLEYASKLPRGQSFVNVMRIGAKCAAAEKQTTGADGRMQYSADEEHLKAIVPLAEAALKVPEGFGDDKGELYTTLIRIAKGRNDGAAAKRYATEMWAFLEDQSKHAPSPLARAALDTWRVSAATELDDVTLAIPALQASERDLADDYNAPSQLASIYGRLGRLNDALASNQRALDRSDGGRRAAFYRTRVSLFEKKGDRAAAKKTLEEAIAFAETLPPPQGPSAVAAFKKQLELYNKGT